MFASFWSYFPQIPRVSRTLNSSVARRPTGDRSQIQVIEMVPLAKDKAILEVELSKWENKTEKQLVFTEKIRFHYFLLFLVCFSSITEDHFDFLSGVSSLNTFCVTFFVHPLIEKPCLADRNIWDKGTSPVI